MVFCATDNRKYLFKNKTANTFRLSRVQTSNTIKQQQKNHKFDCLALQITAIAT